MTTDNGTSPQIIDLSTNPSLWPFAAPAWVKFYIAEMPVEGEVDPVFDTLCQLGRLTFAALTEWVGFADSWGELTLRMHLSKIMAATSFDGEDFEAVVSSDDWVEPLVAVMLPTVLTMMLDVALSAIELVYS